MNKGKNKIAYIVPTKDRPDDLRKLLASFQSQTVKPDQIIVVDGSDEEISRVLDEFSGLKADYVRVHPPGLTRQRNAGKKILKPDIALVGYLDDDIVLENDANEQMLRYFSSAIPKIGGASFNITNNPITPLNRFTKLFFINDGRKGIVLPSGFNVLLSPVEDDTFVEWLSGGATVWRREIINTYDYDEHFGGYGHFDDLDFSYRVGQEYKMMVLKNAKVAHYVRPVKTERSCAFAAMDVAFRFYFVEKHKGYFSKSKCLWATLGLIGSHLLYGLIKGNRADILRVKGYLIGLYKVLTGNMRLVDVKDIK